MYRSLSRTFATSKEIMPSLADGRSSNLTSGHTAVEVHQIIFCFRAQPVGFEDNLKNDVPALIDTRDIDSVHQLQLPPELTPSAITHDELVLQ